MRTATARRDELYPASTALNLKPVPRPSSQTPVSKLEITVPGISTLADRLHQALVTSPNPINANNKPGAPGLGRVSAGAPTAHIKRPAAPPRHSKDSCARLTKYGSVPHT